MRVSSFEVDLEGLMRVFGGHLYSTESVFVRELVQNGLDAVTLAGRPPGVGRVSVSVGEGTVRVDDDGVGLDADGLARHLSRIGASSKRGPERDPGLIGQFGIGLLSAFLVGERLVVETRAADAEPLRWEAWADGRYEVSPSTRAAVGTTVTVFLRPEAARWCERSRVRAALLDHVPHVDLPVDLDGERISSPAAWRSEDPEAVAAWVEGTAGEAPLAVRPVRLAGGGGALWIRRTAAPGGGRCELFHRGVRVQRSAVDLLPPWAGFVGAALDLPALSPTASREGFVRDAAWDAAAARLRDELCAWLRALAAGDDAETLLSAHHLHLLAACLDDDSLLAALGSGLPFQTNAGPLPLGDIARAGQEHVRYASTATAFAQLAPLAGARGALVVDASHTHEPELLRAWARLDGRRRLEALGAGSLDDFVSPAPEHDARFRAVLSAANALLAPVEVAVRLGRFSPADVPALLVADATRLRARARSLLAQGSPLQRALLAGLRVSRRADAVPLVLNVDNPLVSALPGLGDPARAARVVRVLYTQSAVLARHTLSPEESRFLSDDLLAVLTAAAPSTEPVH